MNHGWIVAAPTILIALAIVGATVYALVRKGKPVYDYPNPAEEPIKHVFTHTDATVISSVGRLTIRIPPGATFLTIHDPEWKVLWSGVIKPLPAQDSEEI